MEIVIRPVAWFADNKPDLAQEISSDVEILATLAHQIWTEYYTPMIGPAQVDYMITHFQSPEYISDSICTKSFRYWIAEVDGVPAGYCGACEEDESLFLSKLYIAKNYRGLGISRLFLAELDSWGFQSRPDVDTISLTVHKGNKASIDAYTKLGFSLEEPIVTDIGGGYVMDDYVMRRKIQKI
ncbi:MAG: GNAT family N-acetyltransferase [Propionibacteriaceae bacterium]|jgi:RimJ/RimL family protein N-acetyltransferase|nr:GNAT family N-acetyltransferase [Propionibacteriaceae bacterium]